MNPSPDMEINKNDIICCLELDKANKKRIYLPITHVQLCHVQSEFGNIASPSIEGMFKPITEPKKLIGKERGIQGETNSCYLDSTLFVMFSFSSVFDDMLTRGKNDNDIEDYEKIQEVLRSKIVNPLRRYHFVSADKTMRFRELLDKIPSDKSIMGEEQDAEEFINLLMGKALKVPPLIQFTSGETSYMYQLFVERDPSRKSSPTVQEIFDNTIKDSNVKLKNVPDVLILQMPRMGVQYKVFDKIIPTKTLNVADFIVGGNEGNENGKKNMSLFAVLCIERSHYIAFVRCGPTSDFSWCCFDSMAERIDTVSNVYDESQEGYNIPEVKNANEVSELFKILEQNNVTFDKTNLGNLAKRLVEDSYVAFYEKEIPFENEATYC